jgi:hypothetical protein
MKLSLAKHISVYMSLGMLVSISAFAEIRNITPPNLSAAHLGKKILCHRPMRRGKPMLNIQKSGD